MASNTRKNTSAQDAFRTMAKRHPILALVLIVAVALTTTISAKLDAARYVVPDIEDASSVSLDAWDESIAPNYVLRLGPAQIDRALTSEPIAETDLSGRPSFAGALIDVSMVEEGSARERDDLPNPVGWPKNFECDIVTPDGDTYHGWFWNRSHLVAKSLGGSDGRDNLVTGTRMQNVGANAHPGGMAYSETQVRDFLRAHTDATVEYATTPVYVGLEPIPRSIIVDVRSSDGTLDERLVVYNAQKGYAIDYMTGTVTPGEAPAVSGIVETFLSYLSTLLQNL